MPGMPVIGVGGGSGMFGEIGDRVYRKEEAGLGEPVADPVASPP